LVVHRLLHFQFDNFFIWHDLYPVELLSGTGKAWR